MKKQFIDKPEDNNARPPETFCQWDDNDFVENYYYWNVTGSLKALPIRKSNLLLLARIFTGHGVRFWLYGKTLWSIYKNHDLLPEDKKDEIGVFSEDRHVVQSIVYQHLLRQGFEIIRCKADVLSILRNKCYINIIFFKKCGSVTGYKDRWFFKSHFESFDSVIWFNQVLPVPSNTKLLLDIISGTSIMSYGARFILLLQSAKYIKFMAYKKIIYKLLNYSPHTLRLLLNPVFKTAGYCYRRVTKELFFSLLIEPLNSVNWKWRKPHLDIITNDGKYKSVGAIIDYLKENRRLQQLIAQTRETNTAMPFIEPISKNKVFWQTGNNFFIYCIKYQFRKGVLPYKAANKYIQKIGQPLLYSSSYFESLEPMSDHEINLFLKRTPIEISEGACIKGKHRIFAMIGRLVEGKKYIPFWAILHRPFQLESRI